MQVQNTELDGIVGINFCQKSMYCVLQYIDAIMSVKGGITMVKNLVKGAVVFTLIACCAICNLVLAFSSDEWIPTEKEKNTITFYAQMDPIYSTLIQNGSSLYSDKMLKYKSNPDFNAYEYLKKKGFTNLVNLKTSEGIHKINQIILQNRKKSSIVQTKDINGDITYGFGMDYKTRTIAEKIGEICSSHEFETNEIVSEIKELQRSNPQKFSKNLKKYILAYDERIAKLINEYQKWKNDMTLVNVAILDIVYASTTMPKSLEENIEDINNMIDQGYLTAEQVSVTKRVGGKLLDVSFTSLEDFKYSSGIGTTVVLESVK